MEHPVSEGAFRLLVYCLGALLVGIGFLSVILRPLANEKERDHPGCLWLGWAAAFWCALRLSQLLAFSFRRATPPPPRKEAVRTSDEP
ncbi:hypothetical protein HY375_03985 [Candidatus Berkelbacteria bacterium]|nr:hypothetical protein [Candidatus Berkelbacteria bacterium]